MEVSMHAALVTSFDHPPRYATLDDPVAASADEVLVDVRAAGLHPRVRSGASGAHYASAAALPLIPGVDGTGLLADGQRVYFAALDSAHGTMADRTVIRRRAYIPLPDAAEDVTVAAAVNPAMSSWVPLRRRAALQPGQRVLVLGATGSAGQLAVQIAKRLGAGWVAAAGRDPERLAALPALGADGTISLAGSDAEVAAEVQKNAADIEVVVDYLWGAPMQRMLPAILAARSDPARPLTWVHIGAMGGPEASVPSVALRSHNLTILGSGQGAVSTAEFVKEIAALIDEIAAGALTIDALPVPLSDVETVWDSPVSRARRVVFQP
jgi:NADPH:quinone reductase-like Zn-dependent oxidoreductase